MATFDLPPVAGTGSMTMQDLIAQKLQDEKASRSRRPRKVTSFGLDLDVLSEDDLLELRGMVDSCLPARALIDLNVERELIVQLQVVKNLQARVMVDPEIPANQLAQVAGQVAGTLQSIAKLQLEVHDSERMKALETILVDCIQEFLDIDTQLKFFEEYEKRIMGKSDGA